ncbi:6-bladed beta-propeller [Geotalea sp. SG265]|uniref:6-bladed beta-propeller n=1 Tax=Geotalea sp. SG265 TaxID=2922867 RepID=UPI001FAF9B38|nr:6-bladed beta-propeller [Geotalea sp. SG265]
MKTLKVLVRSIACGLVAGTIFGCASAPVAEKKRFFWPPLPDEPKIEWLGAYRTQNDMPKTSNQKLFESIVGQEEVVKLNRAMGIASDGAGKVYVSDAASMQIVVFDFNVNKVHVLGDKDLKSVMREPIGIALDNTGNLYVVDSYNKQVLVFNKDEALINRIKLQEDAKRPIGIAVDDQRKRLIVADPAVHNLEVYDFNGKHIKTIGKIGSEPGEFFGPTWVTVLKDGTIAVSEFRNCRIQLLDPEGKPIRTFGKRGDNPGELQMPKGIAADSEGHIYSVDGKANTINIFSREGEYLLTVGGTYASEKQIAPGGFLLPQGIAVDKNDTIYVVDQYNYRFQKFQYMNPEYKKANPVEPMQPAPDVKK